MADDKNKTTGDSAPSAASKPVKSSKTKESISVRFTKWLKNKKNEYVSEFKRIVWPTREVLVKETITVIAVSLIFGLYITALDGAFGYFYSQFANFTATLFT